MFVVVVWFCRSSSLAFFISTYLINLMHHFLLHWVLCFGGYLFVYRPVFLKNTSIFIIFLSVPHLVDNYAKILDEGGRNHLCNRTLPSLLVCIHYRKAIRFATFECNAWLESDPGFRKLNRCDLLGYHESVWQLTAPHPTEHCLLFGFRGQSLKWVSYEVNVLKLKFCHSSKISPQTNLIRIVCDFSSISCEINFGNSSWLQQQVQQNQQPEWQNWTTTISADLGIWSNYNLLCCNTQKRITL